MAFTKSAFVLSFLFLLHYTTAAQVWTSYQSPNQVNDLLDVGDELLLATDEGLVVVDKSTLEIETFNRSNSNLTTDHIQAVTQGQNGSIWIGTYDVIMFQFDGNDFSNRTVPNHSAFNQNTEMYDFKVGPNGDFWAATDDGVFRKSGDTWQHYGEAAFGPQFFESWDLEVTDDGDIFVAGREIHQFVNDAWVNISEGSLFEGYLDADLFTSSTGDLYAAGDLDEISRYDGQAWQAYPIGFNGSRVNQFTEDLEGNIYFSSRSDGIFKLENDTWAPQTDAQTTAFGNYIAYFHIDAENKRWMNKNIQLTVSNDGDTRSTLIAEHTLESNRTDNLHKGENGKMYFITGSDNNFSVVDEDGNWSFLPIPPSAMRFEFMNDLKVFDDNDIWLTTQRGLYQYDGTDWTFTDLGPCRDIVTDSQGKVYIPSDAKIYIMDEGSLSELNTSNSSLSSLPLSGIGIDADDNLWIATGDFDLDNVIQKLTPSGDWTTYTTTENPDIERPLGNFYFDSEGTPWIVNEPIGALMFDGTTWANPISAIGNGVLTSRSIDDVTGDGEGTVYFSHTYGISTLKDGEWANFVNEEVETNNSQDTQIAFDDQGNLWWANGRTGVFSFLPEPTTSSASSSAAAANFQLYPNPSQTYTILDFTTTENASVNIAVYNQLGQLASTIDLGQRPAGNHRQELNTAQLPTGFYTVQLNINGRLSARKLVVD